MQGWSKRFQYALRLLDEWQALLLCFIAGAVTALAFAPSDAWYVIFLTIPLYYLLLEAAASRRQAILRGFSFGYGFFMAGTYWIAYALAVDVEKFGWLIPISILGLSAVMALWFALFGWLVWWRRTGHWFADILRFIVLWVVVEYLRSLGIFGFPWNLMGYIALPMGMAQPAAYVGTYGLSLLMLLAAMLPVTWLKQQPGSNSTAIYSATVLIALIVAYGYGMARIPADEIGEGDTMRVRIVQASIPQTEKWTQEGRLKSLQLHMQLSQMQSDASRADAVIWSETAMPFTFFPDSPWPQRLASLLGPGMHLITGVVEADDTNDKLELTNSIVAINDVGGREARYAKHQLVPFGEFVPLRHVLPLEKITPGDGDFSRGPGPQTITLDGLPPFSPLVCYEVIFPWIAIDPRNRPDWILNVTNDAWYGDSPGPYQHFAMSRMRAIEQGLPLVRAANTGISAVISPYGTVIRKLSLNERGIIDQKLPNKNTRTFYSKYIEWPVVALLLAMFFFTSWHARVRKS